MATRRGLVKATTVILLVIAILVIYVLLAFTAGRM